MEEAWKFVRKHRKGKAQNPDTKCSDTTPDSPSNSNNTSTGKIFSTKTDEYSSFTSKNAEMYGIERPVVLVQEVQDSEDEITNDENKTNEALKPQVQLRPEKSSPLATSRSNANTNTNPGIPSKVPSPIQINVQPKPIPIKEKKIKGKAGDGGKNARYTITTIRRKSKEIPVEPFPILYPDYTYKFKCRESHLVGICGDKLSRIDGLGRPGPEKYRHRDLISHTQPNQFGYDPVKSGPATLVLDTSIERFVVHRCSTGEALSQSEFASTYEFKTKSQFKKLDVLDSVEDIRQQSFETEIINFDDLPPEIKPPFKKRVEWQKQATSSQYDDSAKSAEDLQVADGVGPLAFESATVFKICDLDSSQDDLKVEGESDNDSSGDWTDPMKADDGDENVAYAKIGVIYVEANSATLERNISTEDDRDDSISHLRNAAELLKLFKVKHPSASQSQQDQNAGESVSAKFYTIAESKGKLKFIVNKGAAVKNLKEFTKLPAAIGFRMQCTIVRDNKGVDRGFYPTYSLFLEYENGQKVFLLGARKRKRSKTSNYLISTDQYNLAKNESVGKVRSNMLGTGYNIFDDGISPKSTKCVRSSHDYREEMGVVTYDYNILGFRGPRKFRVMIPTMLNAFQRHAHRPQDENDSLIDRAKTDVVGGMIELCNKTPMWLEENESYVLNFEGRVSKASVKNFQLIHASREDYVVLQFGRISEDVFTLDFRFPLCPVQAFAIALSSFDNKLGCE